MKRFKVKFTAKNLTGNAGLVHIGKFADKLQLPQTLKKVFSAWFLMAKTWNQENGKSLKDLATCLPNLRYKRRKISALTGERQKSFWLYRKQTRLNSIGDVK